MSHNGTQYSYLYNLQGDVIGLVDSAGALVVEYKYNAWGSITGRAGSLAATLGKLNPFRYRGYVYDEETWMYWLKSRYYYPEMQRFISADVVVGKVGSVNGHNLYAYCGNEPVDAIDEYGRKETPAINIWNGYLVFGKTHDALNEASNAYEEIAGEPLCIKLSSEDGLPFMIVDAEYKSTTETAHLGAGIGYTFYDMITTCSSEVGAIAEIALTSFGHPAPVGDWIDAGLSVLSELLTIRQPDVHKITRHTLTIEWEKGGQKYTTECVFYSNAENGCKHFDGLHITLSYFRNGKFYMSTLQ